MQLKPKVSDDSHPVDQRFRSLVEKLWDATILLSENGTIVYVSQATAQAFGYTPAYLVGRAVMDFVHPSDRAAVEQIFDDLLAQPGGRAAALFRGRNSAYKWLWIEAAATNLLDEPEIRAIVCRFHDVSERLRTARKLAESEERYRAFVEQSSEGIWRIENPIPIPVHLPADTQIALMLRDAYFAECNPAMARMYGYSDPSEFIGTRLSDFFVATDESNVKQLREFIRGGYRIVDGESNEVDRSGNQKYFLNNFFGVVKDGFLYRTWGTQRDITERKRAEEAVKASEAQLFYRSRHDALTDLPNRSLFLEKLEHAGHQVTGHVGVLFIDIDRFKVINETLGHLVGDRLLIALAERLKRCISPDDTLARLGGDEFAILVERIGNANEARRIADRVLTVFRHPFAVEGHVLLMSASIGIAVGGAVPGDSDNLLRHADVAMTRAKATGKGKYVVYDTALHDRMVRTLRLEADLRGAVERRQFEVHYQPVVALTTGTVVGFEALVRWRHPDLGLIRPMDFIPVAEEAGLVLTLDRWVLREACRQLRAWQSRLGGCPDLTMSVNFSSREFSQVDVVDSISSALDETGLEAKHLKIEITENALIENADTVALAFSELERKGVQIVLDDFGTGYSSLSYLHRFRVDMLKIDRSFVSGMDTDVGRNVEIIRAIAGLAQSLGIEMVAEGIESASQIKQLRALECEFGQGYYFSHPVPAGEALALALAHSSH
jgi:diguanylate cyclase (GGDEF)-like protein/PAS domain S-box-containing protein